MDSRTVKLGATLAFCTLLCSAFARRWPAERVAHRSPRGKVVGAPEPVGPWAQVAERG